MKFSYQARSKKGDIQTGFVEASSREAALNILQKYGLYITFLEEVEAPFWQRNIQFFNRISRKDVVFFTRQLAIMLKSNIPVVESLESIAHQIKKPNFRELVLEMAEEVEGGSTLSKTFSKQKTLFSSFFVGMVKSGEASGTVPESLDYLADYLEKEEDFVSKIITSLIYPAFVLIVFFIVLFAMGIIVVPKFAEVFSGMETDLPLITRVVIYLATTVKEWWFIIAILGISFLISLVFFFKSEETRRFLDKFFLGVPIIGDFMKKYFLTRIALNLSTLISGGVPILQSLEITGDIVGNEVYKNIIEETKEAVRAGQTVSSSLSRYPETFPILFVQMTVVGERTGHLESTLKNIVNLYEKEIDRTLDSFIKLIEPVLILFLGGLVILLAISLFVPLFQRGLAI